MSDTDRAPVPDPKDATDELENGLELAGKIARDPMGALQALGDEAMDAFFGSPKKDEPKPEPAAATTKPALRGIDGGAKCT